MKIMFLVAHLGSGGAERTVSYLTSYFSEHSCDVIVLSVENKVFYKLSEKVKYITLEIESHSKSLFDRFLKISKRYVLTNALIKKHSPDVIVCLIPDLAKYIVFKGKSKLITSERANPNFVEQKNIADLRKKMFKKSDGIIFQTERASMWFEDSIRSKGVVIHNAVGNELVYEVGEVAEREKKISAVGRLSAQKDYPTLFKAFKIVLQKHPDYRLEIFGTGPDEQKLRDLTYELGISENVIFMGVHRDAVLQIANSSCYVMSSVFEGMPNALMEAMAIGLPCVSTDCPNGPAELIENEVSGLLVPVGDSDAIATAICRMIEDKTFAADCGKNAKKILDTHSIEIIAKKYLDYIQSVVEKR